MVAFLCATAKGTKGEGVAGSSSIRRSDDTKGPRVRGVARGTTLGVREEFAIDSFPAWRSNSAKGAAGHDDTSTASPSPCSALTPFA